VRQARLKIGGRDEEIKLLKIKPGKAAPRHTHDGFEATLVLRGAFRDEGKLFVRGDIAIANGRVDHRPRAEGDEDCYCLAVTTGALRVTDNFKRVLRDFLN
jgi:putative transcriptional regulator